MRSVVVFVFALRPLRLLPQEVFWLKSRSNLSTRIGPDVVHAGVKTKPGEFQSCQAKIPTPQSQASADCRVSALLWRILLFSDDNRQRPSLSRDYEGSRILA